MEVELLERGRRAAREGVAQVAHPLVADLVVAEDERRAGAAPRARASPRWRSPLVADLVVAEVEIPRARAPRRCRARRRTPPSPHRPRPCRRGTAPAASCSTRARRPCGASPPPSTRAPNDSFSTPRAAARRRRGTARADLDIGVLGEHLLLELLLEVRRRNWRAAAAADQRAQRARAPVCAWSPCAASSSSDSRSCGGPRCAAVGFGTINQVPGGALGLGRRPRRHVEAVRRRRLEVAEAPLEVRPAAPGIDAISDRRPAGSGVAVILNTTFRRARTAGRCCRARGRTTPAARACCTWCCTSGPPSTRRRAGAST